jgi:dCTP deaminase
MILSYQTIKYRCKYENLIHPWVERSISHGMTYGIGPAGYDIRIAQGLVLPTGKFQLVSSMEHFEMPNDLLAQVVDKSTWARKGLCVQNTVIEPGWVGYLTLELTNHSHLPIYIKQGMPIAQIVFCKLDHPTAEPYRGKYQNQDDRPVPAILESEDCEPCEGTGTFATGAPGEYSDCAWCDGTGKKVKE